jgi:hypothetical protein
MKTITKIEIKILLFVCLSKVEDELQVILTIKDLNDNHPEFLTFENPVQVSVSSQLQAGDIIAKMEVSFFLLLIDA